MSTTNLEKILDRFIPPHDWKRAVEDGTTQLGLREWQEKELEVMLDDHYVDHSTDYAHQISKGFERNQRQILGAWR